MSIDDQVCSAWQPLVLLVPGLDNSGSDHWQSLWERDDRRCKRVELGRWYSPHRNTWVNQLNLAIYRAGRPVVLVAHGLGCHVVAWWAEYEQPVAGGPVIGALLVAPPDVEGEAADLRLKRFAPLAGSRLPFKSFVVASENDPWASFGSARRFARKWGSLLINAGPIGHINADSGIGDWHYGRYLLSQLAAEVSSRPALQLTDGAVAGISLLAPASAEVSR